MPLQPHLFKHPRALRLTEAKLIFTSRVTASGQLWLCCSMSLPLSPVGYQVPPGSRGCGALCRSPGCAAAPVLLAPFTPALLLSLRTSILRPALMSSAVRSIFMFLQNRGHHLHCRQSADREIKAYFAAGRDAACPFLTEARAGRHC